MPSIPCEHLAPGKGGWWPALLLGAMSLAENMLDRAGSFSSTGGFA